MIKKIKFEGIEVKYDDSALGKWSVMRDLASGTNTFSAYDTILCGKADQVAEKLGDSMDAMTKLLEQITTVSGTAKN